MTLFQSFRDYLRRLYPEVNVSIEPESSIGFSYKSFNFRYSYSTDEPHYYRLALPRVAVREDVDIKEVYKLACEISAKYKVGKVELIGNDFWICYEQIIIDPDANNDSVYDFSIRVLSSMITDFRDGFNKLNPTR